MQQNQVSNQVVNNHTSPNAVVFHNQEEEKGEMSQVVPGNQNPDRASQRSNRAPHVNDHTSPILPANEGGNKNQNINCSVKRDNGAKRVNTENDPSSNLNGGPRAPGGPAARNMAGAPQPSNEQCLTKMDALEHPQPPAEQEEEAKEEPAVPLQEEEEEEDNMDIEIGSNFDLESLNKELPFCRFCWVNETSQENPLISSCKCRGGVQHVHFGCLKEWVKTKRLQKEQAHISSYLFKQFECEICKTPYPYVFKAGGTRYKLIELPVTQPKPPGAPGAGPVSVRPTGDYLVLESLTLEKNTSRILHVLTPTLNIRTILLGRGHDSDLRINDISVSRQHAVIRFKNDGFYLQDSMSKFGTLVLIRKRLPLNVSITKAI